MSYSIYSNPLKEDFTEEDGITHTHFDNINKLRTCLAIKDISKFTIITEMHTTENMFSLKESSLIFSDQEDIKLFKGVIAQNTFGSFLKK